MRSAETRVVERATAVDTEGASNILVLIHGAGLGKKFELDGAASQLSIGRDIDTDISIDDDSVSRKHCEIRRHGTRWLVQDLNSTNGTYVGGVPIGRVILHDGDLLKVGSTIFKFLSTANVEAAYHEEIYRMAIFDGLTQIHNRRYLLEFVEREISRSLRHERHLSLLIFDVDHFKQINDQFGHLSGDYVLRYLSRCVSLRVRREELFARYAGDEFVIVLPETPPSEAMIFGEAIRKLIDEEEFVFDQQALPVTVSIGVGALTTDIRTPEQLIAAADAALYRAKERGRNLVLD